MHPTCTNLTLSCRHSHNASNAKCTAKGRFGNTRRVTTGTPRALGCLIGSWCPEAQHQAERPHPFPPKTHEVGRIRPQCIATCSVTLCAPFGPLASRCCFSQQPSTKDNPQVHHGVDGQLQANTYLPAHGRPRGCAGGAANPYQAAWTVTVPARWHQSRPQDACISTHRSYIRG